VLAGVGSRAGQDLLQSPRRLEGRRDLLMRAGRLGISVGEGWVPPLSPARFGRSSIRPERVVDDVAPASVRLTAHDLRAVVRHLDGLAVRTGALEPPRRAQ